jgi:hypothetical protein
MNGAASWREWTAAGDHMKSLAVRFEAEQERCALRHLRVADLVAGVAADWLLFVAGVAFLRLRAAELELPDTCTRPS